MVFALHASPDFRIEESYSTTRSDKELRKDVMEDDVDDLQHDSNPAGDVHAIPNATNCPPQVLSNTPRNSPSSSITCAVVPSPGDT